MFYDTLTVAAICDELRQTILDGWVQRIVRLSAHSLGCEIYANHERHWLLMSAHPQNARVHLTAERLARASEDVTPLLLLLRKHVRDGRITAISQPPLERILVLSIAKRSDDRPGAIEECKLIIETMGRHSNIILTDASDVVLDSLRRVPAQLSRYRVVLPQHPYVPPPSQGKPRPADVTQFMLGERLRALPPSAPAWQGLVAGVAGMSPLLARETVFRATGDAQTAAAAVMSEPPTIDRLIEIIQTLYSGLLTHLWAPSTVRTAVGRVTAFAPYELRHLLHPEPCASINTAVSAYYADLEQFSREEQQKEQLRDEMEQRRRRHVRRKEALERELAQGTEAERLRRNGEAILASLAGIRAGQRELVVEDLEIALDPTLSPVENAQAYFREYKKAKAALRQVPDMLADEAAALAYLAEVDTQLALAGTVEDVRRVAADLREGSEDGRQTKAVAQQKVRGKDRQTKVVRPRKTGPPPYRILPGGFAIYAGKSARQNEEITFHVAGPDDLWLHARGVPGAHVVIKGPSDEVPEAVVEAAARLAAGFSQARASARVAVDCTQRKHVRRVRSGLPGLVTYGEERTLHVPPEGAGTREAE